MKELNNLVTRLDSICRKTIEDIDKSDINDFGITYCESSIKKGTSDGYDVVVRFHKWGRNHSLMNVDIIVGRSIHIISLFLWKD